MKTTTIDRDILIVPLRKSNMKVLKAHIKLVMTVFCLTHLSALVIPVNAGDIDPVLVPEKPIAALTGSNANKPESASPADPNQASTSKNHSEPAAKATAASDAVLTQSEYPLISKMEVITFGQARSNGPIEERLSGLENEIFHATYKDKSLFDRTQKLKLTILGPNELVQDENIDFASSSAMIPLLGPPLKQITAHEPEPQLTYFELIAQSAENQLPVDAKELPNYALELVNKAREQLNFPLLSLDKTAASMAEKQIADLGKRRLVSHTNEHGENPDLRYTKLGGDGAIMESVVSLKPGQVKDNQYSRALVAHALKLLIDRQDDRESLLSPDATGFGFALTILPEQKRAIACIEVSTTHGVMSPIPHSVAVGDKIEINGNVVKPYKFAKLTIAWEGLSSDMASEANENDEALPYFPPLDYVGYKHKSEHDYGAITTALKMGCLVGVIAGGVFIPPVALAAPLILMSPGGNGEPKPMSDIPLHGGIKVDGDNFSGKVSMSNAGKPGIYYVTVWATLGKNPKPVPISRRAFVLTEKNSMNDKHS